MAVYNDENNLAAVEQHGRKMKLLEVRRILETETDPEHMLTANQIATKLAALGFHKPDSKGIYDDINVLNFFIALPTSVKPGKRASLPRTRKPLAIIWITAFSPWLT